jgi:hypothetical protein
MPTMDVYRQIINLKKKKTHRAWGFNPIKSAIDKSIVRVTPRVSAQLRYERLGSLRVQAMSVGGHIPSPRVAPRYTAIALGTDFEQHSAKSIEGWERT